MARIEIEAQYLSTFWHLAEKGSGRLDEFSVHIEPAMLEHPGIARAYGIVRERHVKGQPLNDFDCNAQLREALGENFDTIWEDHVIGGKILRGYASEILLNHRAREQVRILRDLADETERRIGGKESTAHKLANDGIGKLINLHHDRMGSKNPHTREEFIGQELGWMERGSEVGIQWPYPKLQDAVGPVIAGDLITVAAYSNGGKSLLSANLFDHFTKTNPCIVVPTEMGPAWLSRALAAASGVPQSIAERRQWALATPDQRMAYELAAADYKARKWELINRRRITPQEVIARASVLRRKYPGQLVVVIVDHMHRMDYGGMEPDLLVGDATVRMREWAAEDQEGGIALVLLYQPRKPSDEMELYKPVMGHQVRGKSSVWNEADIMLSPYRRWVKCDTTGVHKTAWGTPSTLFANSGLPDFTKPNDPAGKLDDQHVYLKVAKRRVGGEGPTVMLDIDGASGRISDRTAERNRQGLVAVR